MSNIIDELPSIDAINSATSNSSDQQQQQQQPHRSDYSLLLDIFKVYRSKEEALEAMHKNISKNPDKRYSDQNGKTYSESNCRRAIRRLDERGKFTNQTNTTTPKTRELTYKMDTPNITPFEPEHPQTDTVYQQPQNQTLSQNDNTFQQQHNETNTTQQQQEQFNNNTPIDPFTQQPTTIQPQPLRQEYVFVEPSERDVEAVKDIAQIGFKKIAKLADDPSAELDDYEGKKLGRAVCILLGGDDGKLDPRKVALVTVGITVVTRADAIIKAGKKVGVDAVGMIKGGKPQ
ncbi:MAG: hypothetical protein FWC33_06045 [Candidatus Bathyarchaeota archaeon]|nr:hypothetical protein [Candidatus Termiticorpusculum sp.]